VTMSKRPVTESLEMTTKRPSRSQGGPQIFIAGTIDGTVSKPLVGFGTYKFKGPGAAQRAVTEALRAGYRHIDTAFCYGGEKVLILT
jgi:hypothetical protein